MTGRSPALCRRHTARHANNLRLATCLADQLACLSVESDGRHGRAAPARLRYISSHRGPLESRQRSNNKRKMTGAMMPMDGAEEQAAWFLDLPYLRDMRDWKAPSTVAARQKKRSEFTVSNLAARFVDWLEAAPAPEPFAHSPKAVANEAINTSLNEQVEDVAVDLQDIPRTRELELRNDAIRHLEGEVRNILDTDREAPWVSRTEIFDGALQQLKAGEIKDLNLLSAFSQVGLDAKRRTKTESILAALACQAHISVLSMLQSMTPTHGTIVADSSWATMVRLLCEEEAYVDNAAQLALWLLMVMPETARHQVHSQNLHTLIKTLATRAAQKSTNLHAFTDMSVSIGRVLSMLSEPQRNDVFASMSACTWHAKPSEGGEIGMKYHMGFAWLAFRAFDRGTTTESFIEAYHEAIADRRKPLRLDQFWYLIMARLVGSGIIAVDVEAAVSISPKAKYTHVTRTARWSALMEAVAHSADPQAGFREIYAILRGIGRHEELATALAAPMQTDNGSMPRADLTFACGGSPLLCVVGAQPAQDWSAWNQIIRDMVMDSELEPFLWEAFVNPHAQRRAPSRHIRPDRLFNKMAFLEAYAKHILAAPHLTNRQRLRRCENIRAQQLSIGRQLTPGMVSSLADAATSEMQRGKWDPYMRHKWLTGVIKESLGEEQANKAEKHLRGWKWSIAQLGGGKPQSPAQKP